MSITLFYALNFFRLCAKACSPNSISTFSNPLRVKLLKFRLCLSCVNVGSTSAVRCFLLISPISDVRSFCALCLWYSNLCLLYTVQLFFPLYHGLHS